MMKRFAFALLALSLSVSVAKSDLPDPSFSTVTPSDLLNGVCLIPPVIGGDVPAIAENVVVVRDFVNQPVVGGTVVFEFTSLTNTCPTGVFTGVTDANGEVTITLTGGGCAHIVPVAATIKVNGVTIRAYENAKSCDYDGASGDGQVGLPDLIKFSREFLALDPNECHDYNNDGTTGIEDLVPFSVAFVRGGDCAN